MVGDQRSLKGSLVKRFLITSIVLVSAVVTTYFLPYGFWAQLGGLPAHPLIVHGVVVLLPLISIFVLVALFKKRLMANNYMAIIFALGVSTIGVIAAKSSGDSLAAAVGLPQFHAEWGNNLVPLAMAFFGVFVLFSFFTFQRPKAKVSKLLSVVVALLCLGSIGMTYVVGHSGAESVWKEKYAQSKAEIVANLREISAEEVAQHNEKDDCWTIVGGNVYDVTSFANRHPAGSSAINEMCGKDANEDFLSEHAGQAEPEFWLETLKIGVLKQ